jgi:hypothetical protein
VHAQRVDGRLLWTSEQTSCLHQCLVDGLVVGQVELATVPALPLFLSRVCSSRPISTSGRYRQHGHTGTAALMWPSHLGSPQAELIGPMDACGLTGARVALPVGPPLPVLACRRWPLP